MPTRNAAIGNVVPMAGASHGVPDGSPPTSYAAVGALTGEPGALLRFSALTALRSLIIAPGLAVAGVRGKQLLFGSLASSITISVSALIYAAAIAAKTKQAEPEAVIDASADGEEV